MPFGVALRNASGPAASRRSNCSVRGNENYYLIGQIRRRHWLAQGRQVGLSTQGVEALIEELIAAMDLVLSKVAAGLPAGFPADLADAILEGVRWQSRKLAGMPA
ncbi:putative transcriptional regulator [Cupriavidus basilensis OR16]|uniref:Putative transcriptional regulator n=1 Tax=Cupriavidus basilensis OR16 TaxID=1127483 RepID=H1SHX4_9BURK|nr:hypothetical protein [Cupriavidus basilensis]EHP37899.1 putative transcriptional regulator [Cupriavidus basilensis OR16]